MDLIDGYKNLIDSIEALSGMSRPMLHIHAGMAIYILSQLIFRNRRGSVAALMAVLVAELFNELMNRLYHGVWHWDDTVQDIALTLFWPTVCVATSLVRRPRWQRARLRNFATRRYPAAQSDCAQESGAGFCPLIREPIRPPGSYCESPCMGDGACTFAWLIPWMRLTTQSFAKTARIITSGILGNFPIRL